MEGFICRKKIKHSDAVIDYVVGSLTVCQHEDLEPKTNKRFQCVKCEVWFWGSYLCALKDYQAMKRGK